MIGYVTIGTNDLPRAMKFYDDLLAPLGIQRIMDFGRGYAWGSAMGQREEAFRLEGARAEL